MKTIAFGDGEAVTYLRGERNWIAVSGVKGDRIFYRKAILACAGKSWHHIAFEYPVVLKREMDAFVVGAANIVDRTENEGCDDANPSVSQDSERPPGNSAAR
jgi:serine/threonine-protein kinase